MSDQDQPTVDEPRESQQVEQAPPGADEAPATPRPADEAGQAAAGAAAVGPQGTASVTPATRKRAAPAKRAARATKAAPARATTDEQTPGAPRRARGTRKAPDAPEAAPTTQAPSAGEAPTAKKGATAKKAAPAKKATGARKAAPATRSAEATAPAAEAATATGAKHAAAPTGTGRADEGTATGSAQPARRTPSGPGRATGKRATAKRTARTVGKAAGRVVDKAGAAVESASSAARRSEDSHVVAPKRLSGFDFATWRSAASDPIMRSPMIGLVALGSSPDWDRLVERFDRASRVAPILRQKILEGPSDILSPRLVIDPDFDLSFHMRRFRVPEPGSWDQVLDETRRQSMADFDQARPLWRVTLLEGLQGGGAALIVKLHHAIADGQGAMMLGATVIDLTPEDQDLGPMPPTPMAPPLDTAGFLGNAVADGASILMKAAREVADAALPLAGRALTDPMGAVDDLMNVVRSASKFMALPSRPMSPLMTGRSINYHFLTFDVPLDELKQAGRAAGQTLNDAFLAGVTGGLRIYHERRDEPVARLRCNMPISLRDPNRPAQNAVTIARFEVPVSIVDPRERMAAIHEIVDSWRNEPALHLVDPLAEVGMRLMPTEVVTSAAQKSDFTASNVPGVPIPVYVAGAKVLAMYPLMSTVGAATNITLLSYAGMAGIGVSMDDAAIPDRADFLECLREGFAEVVGHPVELSDPYDSL